MFALLGVTGMRVSEALALRLEDVTADGLLIRDTKFGNIRNTYWYLEATPELLADIANACEKFVHGEQS